MNNELKYRILSSLILLPVVFFFIIKGSHLFNFFISIVFFITCYEWYFMSKNKKYSIFGYFFLIISFLAVIQFRNNFGNHSLFYFIFVTLICISTDIGGYVFGKLFKGPKLTKISPNKTFSGMIGGISLSLIVIFFLVKNEIFETTDLKSDDIKLIFYVLFISIISQIGDIIVSYFKRISNLKDTGNLIPGHGGVLDRIDGMLFAYPVSYLLFSL